MKLTVARSQLLPALATATRVADRKNTIPILSNLLFRSDGESLTIVGTNLDQEITTTVPVISGDALASTVPAVNLHDAIKTLPESAEVTMSFDDKFVVVTSGKARFRLPVLPAGDFHTLAANGWSHEFKLDAAVIRAMFDATSFAVERGKTGRIYLQGIFLHAVDGRLVAVATDGKRVARQFAACPEGAAGMPGVILPDSAIPLIESICGDKGEVSVSVSAARVRFASASASILTTLVDGTYPDYERIIPTNNDRRFRIGRSLLDLALARVLSIGTSKGNGVKFSFGTGGALSLAASGEDRTSNDELECAAESDMAVDIGINGAWTREVLGACAADEVVFALNDNASPVVVEPVGNPDQIFIIMPMRI